MLIPHKREILRYKNRNIYIQYTLAKKVAVNQLCGAFGHFNKARITNSKYHKTESSFHAFSTVAVRK